MCKEIGCRVRAYVMGDVATLPDSNVLRVQIWIRTSFYSLRRVTESYSSRSALGSDLRAFFFGQCWNSCKDCPLLRLSQVLLIIVKKVKCCIFFTTLFYIFCINAHLLIQAGPKVTTILQNFFRIRYIHLCMFIIKGQILWIVAKSEYCGKKVGNHLL